MADPCVRDIRHHTKAARSVATEYLMEKTHNCENCPIRARYDRAPRSLIGRFWRWHIGFCPGWRRYMASLDEPARAALRQKYGL